MLEQRPQKVTGQVCGSNICGRKLDWPKRVPMIAPPVSPSVALASALLCGSLSLHGASAASAPVAAASAPQSAVFDATLRGRSLDASFDLGDEHETVSHYLSEHPYVCLPFYVR